MWTIPFECLSIRSAHPPPELERRLKLLTRSHFWQVRSQADARFVGWIADSRFRLMYVPDGRNTYAPWLLGHLLPDGNGSLMEIRMTIHPIAGIGVIALACFPFLGWGITQTNLVWLGVMVGFHVAMYNAAFKSDAHNAESLLHELSR
jgi:hypothetical protein